MTSAPRLRVCIGHGRVRVPGYLSMDDRADADIPFRAGDDFPFTDRAIESIVVAGMATVQEAPLLGLLLECRRALRVNGALRIVLGRRGDEVTDTSTAELAIRMASMAGLRPHPTSAQVTRHATGKAPTVLDFTKPDRQRIGRPLVSIAIPAYRARFFRAALMSALAQSYDEVEILVCDDSGGEEIATIVRDCDARNRVRYVRNPTRLGGRANYRQGFVLAQGDFVKFLNDDDTLGPDCVERLLEAFRGAPDVVLATSYRRRIDDRDQALPDQAATMPIVDRDTLIAGVSLANVMLMTGLNIVGEPSTVLFRKDELADQAPDYFRFHRELGRGLIDMTIWSALLLRGDAVYVRDSLSAFRIHADQQQNDPGLIRRSTAATRALQSAWRALGLHRRVQAYTLLAKPCPFDAEADWVPQRVRSFQRIDVSSLTEHVRALPVAPGPDIASP